MTTQNQFGLAQDVVDKLCLIFSQHSLIRVVIIYGSRAIGNYLQGSDLDLCLDAEGMDLTELLLIENQIDELSLPWKVDLVLKSRIDNPKLPYHINQFGQIFYSCI